MNLIVRALMAAFQEVLDRKQVKARVEYKINRQGQIVIGVILTEIKPA